MADSSKKIPSDLIPVSADHGKGGDFDKELASIGLRTAAPKSAAPSIDDGNSLLSYINKNLGIAATKASPAKPPEPGSSPSEALPHSPLSPIERAAFGRVKHPDQKLDFLQSNYGNENVVPITRDGAVTFAVKENDGIWKQVDPSGLSDLAFDTIIPHALGGKAGFKEAGKIWKELNLKDLIGGAAQVFGKDGGKIAAATMAAPQGMAYGASLGPIGVAAGGIIAAGIGAAGEGGVENAVEAGMNKLNPKLNIGPQDPKDFAAQAGADFILGALNEAAPMAANAILKTGAKPFAMVIKRVSDTPEGRDAAAQLLTMLGHDPATARIRTDNPMGVAEFDKIASSDRINNTDTLGSRMKGAVGSFMDSAQAARKALGRQYDPLQKEAAKATFDVSPDLLKSFDVLKDRSYVDAAGNPAVAGGLERNVTGANREALDTVLKIKSDLLEKIQGGKPLKFGELDNAINNIDNHLYGQNMVNDKTLGASLTQIQVALKNARSEGLQSYNPAVAQGLASLDKTYGPVKSLMQDLGDKSQPGRVDAFMKQVVRDDGSFNSELMNSIKALLPETENPTQTILEMHTAKKAAQSGVFVWNPLKHVLPKSPKGAAIAATTYSSVKNFMVGNGEGFLKGNEGSVTPYLKKVVEQFRSLDPDTQEAIAKSSDALKAIQGMVIAAPQQEAAQKQQLLVQSGALTPKAAQQLGMQPSATPQGAPAGGTGGPGLGAGGQPPQIPAVAPQSSGTNPGFSGEASGQ